jgi:hypothetical protein
MSMPNWKPTIALVLITGGLSIPPVRAQQGAAKGTKAAPLTATDYREIQQLVARYSYALDSAAGDGAVYASLFAADGILRAKTDPPYEVKGRDKLAAFVTRDLKKQGPLYVHTFAANHIIQPSPEGATGRVYLVAIDIQEDANPGLIREGGRFDDLYVKTREGWRFKTRTYIPSKLGPRTDSPPPSR